MLEFEFQLGRLDVDDVDPVIGKGDVIPAQPVNPGADAGGGKVQLDVYVPSVKGACILSKPPNCNFDRRVQGRFNFQISRR